MSALERIGTYLVQAFLGVALVFLLVLAFLFGLITDDVPEDQP